MIGYVTESHGCGTPPIGVEVCDYDRVYISFTPFAREVHCLYNLDIYKVEFKPIGELTKNAIGAAYRVTRVTFLELV